jgi:hypothetical protein
MGMVIRFPAERRASLCGVATQASPHTGTASVVILPVIRIERHDGDSSNNLAPQAGHPGSGGRRRPGRRS